MMFGASRAHALGFFTSVLSVSEIYKLRTTIIPTERELQSLLCIARTRRQTEASDTNFQFHRPLGFDFSL